MSAARSCKSAPPLNAAAGAGCAPLMSVRLTCTAVTTEHSPGRDGAQAARAKTGVMVTKNRAWQPTLLSEAPVGEPSTEALSLRRRLPGLKEPFAGCAVDSGAAASEANRYIFCALGKIVG